MGEFFALLTALFWAGAVILFKRSGETLSPLALNLFRVVVSLVLLLVTLPLMGQSLWRTATVRELAALAASGIVGIAVADCLFHASLNRIGAALNSIVGCLYPPFTALCAYLILGERITRGDLVGMALVTAAVVVATQTRPLAGQTRRTLVFGILLGAAGMASLSFGVVIVKPVLQTQPIVWVTTMRQIVALVVLLLMSMHPGERAAVRGIVRMPRSTLRFALPGAILGSYLALICWLAGMKFTSAGTAAILNETSVIYIIVLARVFLGEPFTQRRIAACLLAVAGVATVFLT